MVAAHAEGSSVPTRIDGAVNFTPRRFLSAVADKGATTSGVASPTKRKSSKSAHSRASGPPARAAEPIPRKRGATEDISIVVVDDHPLFRHGLVQLLNSEAAFDVIGEASSAPEALTIVRRLRPTMVIVDLGLKGPSGLELTKSLRVEFPKMPVLVLSMHDEPTYAV
jgi:PleD family two-component response regulator